LFDLYGDLPNSHFLKIELNQWKNNKGIELDHLEKSLSGNVKNVIFLSLDAYVYGLNYPYFKEFLSRINKKITVFGILHRVPWGDEEISNLNNIGCSVGVILLDQNLKVLIQEITLSEKTYYLPHHAVLAHLSQNKEMAIRRRKLPADKFIISMLGEIREGKGIRKLLDALVHIKTEIKQKTLFLIAGKATSTDPNDIQSAFVENGFTVRIVSGVQVNDYKYVSDPELADYVSASDLGLLLYNGPQELCASGILPNYTVSGIPVLASRDSIVGRSVKENHLGWVCDVNSPIDIANSIENAVNQVLSGKIPVSRKHQDLISDKRVLTTLSHILNDTGLVKDKVLT
jgi:glycosyltransferase involved in cell wall biosynthesis